LTDECDFCNMNHCLVLLRGEEILIPEECTVFGRWNRGYQEIMARMRHEGVTVHAWWWAHEAEKRGLPAMYCEVTEEGEMLFIKALQPAQCFPLASETTDVPGTLLPFRREIDKELFLRITDLMNDIEELGVPEATRAAYFPDYPGLDVLELSDEMRLELICCTSLADIHERLLPMLKQEVDTLHATEHLLGLLRGDAYLRPDAE
jgi:hypothetical protein